MSAGIPIGCRDREKLNAKLNNANNKEKFYNAPCSWIRVSVEGTHILREAGKGETNYCWNVLIQTEQLSFTLNTIKLSKLQTWNRRYSLFIWRCSGPALCNKLEIIYEEYNWMRSSWNCQYGQGRISNAFELSTMLVTRNDVQTSNT